MRKHAADIICRAVYVISVLFAKGIDIYTAQKEEKCNFVAKIR